jgi:CheY-like chemotaxis protein
METSKKILLVEDNQMHQFMYSHQFQQSGVGSVEIASNGEEGLKKAQEQKPNLILLDIVLEGDSDLDGVEVLKRLKEDPHTKDIPVVILSNKRAKDMAATVQELGAAAYLLKADYTPQEVAEYVKQYFKN